MSTAVASPCVQLCRIDPRTGFCEGCFRSLQEIERWPGATDPERRAILRRVAERRACDDWFEGALRGECDPGP